MACYLITGDDESLMLTAIGELVKKLVGDGDRTLMVDDFNGEEFEMRSVVDAAQTAPFLTDKRVVLARGVGRFNADDVGSLVAYIDDPLPSTELVLVAGGGRMAKAVTDAMKRAQATTIEEVGGEGVLVGAYDRHGNSIRGGDSSVAGVEAKRKPRSQETCSPVGPSSSSVEIWNR